MKGYLLFIGFIIEVLIFLIAGALLLPFVILGLFFLAIGIIWAVIIGKGIEKYTIHKIYQELSCEN